MSQAAREFGRSGRLTERSSLDAQLPALLVRIERADKAVKRLSGADPTLYERLKHRFDGAVEEARGELEELRKKASTEPSTAASWEAFARTSARCALLFGDCLAFLQGVLFRPEGIDGGLCRVADRLLDDLSDAVRIDWERLTVLSDDDFYGHLAQIVRLRFPETTIWNLPVAAHEFGHFVGPEITTKVYDGRRWSYRHPFQEILERESQKGEKAWSLADELFADVFATYSVGPAYAYTCILLRFDPSTPHKEFFRHPSSAKRVAVILETLKRMNVAKEFESPYTFIIDDLEHMWEKSVAAAGQSLSSGQGETLDPGSFDELYGLIDERLSGARYSSFARASILQGTLAPGDRPPATRGEDTIQDVLNAAWLCRIENWDEFPEKIGERAMTACLAILSSEDR